ncbi:MAG TPA: carboxypeptidase-like regulatory domain-containing protein [Thermoguttaceae bacterium]|nr:carboxypeptidase-like regulatory domain-containing protein [Thermoguttaceae bacterium]
MRRTVAIQRAALWLAVVGFCVPQAAIAGVPSAKKAPVIVDVALRDGGVLVGQVLHVQGSPLTDVPVVLRSGDRQLGVSKTDEAGLFAFRGVRSGVYQVVAAERQGTYRLWPQKTAPPSAKPGALIVVGKDTVRGQRAARTFRNLMANPWVVGGIIATAVAVPVAIHNCGSSSP